MKIICLMSCLLLPVVMLAADKKNTGYSKIYKIVNVDGMTEYGVATFKKETEEKTFVEKKEKDLQAEYESSMKDYKEAMAEFQKSQEKDKKPPEKVVKPSFTLEGRSYTSEKDLKKMEETLTKKKEEAEKMNKKLEEARNK